MSARIISYEDYKKQNQNSDIVNTIEGKIKSNKQREEEAKKTYEETKQKQTEINKLVDTTIRDERKKLNLPQPVLKPLTTTTKVVKNDNGTTSFKSPFEQNMENSQNFRQQAGNIAKAYETIESSPKIQQLKQIATEANNARLLAKYNYDVEKENNHEITFLDRTLGVPYRAAMDFLNLDKVDGSSFETGYTTPMYVDEKGNKMFLPSANQMRQEKVRNSYDDSFLGKVAQFGTDVGYNITKIGLSTAINALTAPTGVPVGSVMYFSDMGFDNFNQAKLDGYDDASAALFSVLGVTSEMLTEKFLGGFAKKLKLGKGESSLSTFYNGLLGKLLKNDKVRSVLSNALSEGTEEFVQEFIENFNKNLVLKKENLVDATKNTFNKDVLEDAWYSALVGMGSGGLMSLGNPVINTNNTGILPALTKEGNVNVDSYTSDLQNALSKPRYQNRADNINQTIDYLNLNKAMGNNEVAAQTMNNNIQALAPVLSQYSSVLGTSNDNVLPSRNNQVVLPRASDNINTNESINQTENITDRLQYAPTSNEKVNNLYNTASQYFNNSEQTTNLMNTLSKVIKDKNYNIVFDNTNMNGINGKIETKNGEVTITLNPDSPRAFEFVAVHEITHAIETNSLKNMIMSYAKKNGEFNAALDSLKKAYGTNDISSEVIADISGQLLGNQEFINNLSMEQPGLFKRLYNNIKAFYHKLRGWKSQDEFVQDLMNKWEYAYATQQNNLKKQSYSKQDVKTTNDLNEYIADAASREAQQNELNRQSIRENIESYISDNDIKNPTIEDMMNSMDDYDMMDAETDITELNKANKLYREVAEELYNEKYAKPNILKVDNEAENYAKEKGYTFRDNGNLVVSNLTNQQINELVKIYKTTGYDDVSSDYLRARLKDGEMPLMREVADRFIEKELGYKPKYDTTKITQDADGNKLTKAQIEFYKDSDVRDIRGRLIPVYHRTNAEFTEFDSKAGKQHGNKYGKGFYFSITPENYGNNTMQVYLNAKEGEFKYIPSKGYYIVQNANQIKNVTNTNPTSTSNDIRYSKNAAEWQNYVENNFKNEGTITNNSILNQAKVDFGTTTNLNEAGYLTTDGEYLDFSGKNQGAKGGTRTLDHRDIADSYSDAEYDAAENKYSNMGSATAILQDFIDRGNIRLNNTGIEIATAPTQQQYNALYDYLEHIQKTNGEVFIDLDNETKNRTNLEYNEKTSISKMINDIKEHYNELNQDVKYSKNATEWNDYLNKTFSKDNEGRNLSKQQREYFKDSKVVDNNGNLITVYHTTTDEVAQFNEFNPVGTKYYRFGEQVVNYYTNSKNMSGSYSSQDYQMADTTKINNMSELNNYLHNEAVRTNNVFNIEKSADGKYILSQESELGKEAKSFINKLSENEIQQMRDNIYYDEKLAGTPYEKAFSWDKFDKELQTKYNNVLDKYMGTADLVAMQQQMMKYIENPNLMSENTSSTATEVVKTYNSESEMFRNIKQDIQNSNWSKNSKIQYEGYLDIKNPYVIDAEERNWNQVVQQSNEFIDELEARVPDDVKNNLTRLYNESAEKSAAARESYDKYQKIINEIGNERLTPNIDNDIRKMNAVIKKVGIDEIKLLSEDVSPAGLGVNTWYNLSDVLKQEGVIGDATASFIIDEFKIPETVQEWLNNNLNKKINYEGVNNLKQLYEDNYEAYNTFDKYRMPQDYFIQEISAENSDYLGNDLEDILETRAEIMGADAVGEEIAQAASVSFSKPELIRLWGTSKTTNDIVKEVIASNTDGKTNYDGVIIKNVYDYGGRSNGETTPNDVYVTFNSNQFKAADNTNPTADSDIRYSKNNKTWQQYLEENYISRGTRTFGKDIRKQETQNKSADHKVIQKAIEETNTLKGDNVLKAKPKETTPVEQKQDNSRLTKAEQKELSDLEILYPVGMTTEAQDVRLEYLQNKRDGLIKYPELKQKVEFKDISKEYTKFKNDIGKFDSKLLNEAKDSIKGYRNTKTKQQWLEVAENIGLHFKGNSQQLTDYAVQSWFEAQPNNKNSLNREGKGYVKFSIDEWVNAVYKGAGVGDVMPRPKAQTTTKVDTNTTYTTSDIDNMFQFDDNDNRIIALPDAVGERLATKTNMTPVEVGNLQNILYSATNTVENGNQLEITSDYDNNIYTIKATKVGDAYVIDDVTKGTKNALGSVANIETTTNDEVESIDNKKSKIENGQTIGEVINNMKQQAPDIKSQYKQTVENATDMKESSFYKNATETSQFLTEDNRSKLSQVGDLKYYEGVSNEESLAKASKRLSDYGTSEALRWMNQDNKTSSATDVAEGWILLKNYQDAGDYESMVAVAKKMREMGTVAGQTIQAYNIMQRLTPEGMVKYAQSELSEAYEAYAKNKSKSWVEKNANRFDLNAQEVEFIVDTMNQVQNMEDGRAKNVKLAEIQKMLTDKLPVEKGSRIKAWMRISMLFNPKTQIRNVLGNAIITPVNMVGDFFASAADKIIAKKTNTRTTGNTDIKSYLKGYKKGIYESYDDFKRGINTRDIKGNRFEIGQGKSFSDKNVIGRTLNKVDALNSFMLDVGDRGFYEASFTNSINNQLALNNTTIVTPEMVDIATSEALQRTWQDNNNYTKFVLTTRNMLNKVNVRGYGLGDLLIPFAKTPANLTKAIVDYSPAGLVTAIKQGINLKNDINTGRNTAVQQHQFVQSLGKATAGTLLYVAAYGLAKAGIATGQSDDDKDTRDFIKNTLGISSYSIKIGDKSFTYDWAQPIAAPLSIMTNIVNSKNNKGVALLEAITSSLDSAGSILLEQSFLKSINEVLTDNDGIVSGLENAMLDLPARGIPTFMKQIVDMTDSTQRQTFEYNQPLKTAYNKIKAKIPGLSYTLEPSVDTLGREIQKYGGKNNIFNVFLNPANVNTSNISDAAKEIYKVYKEVGDKTIMPRVAPYYINSKGEKTILNTEQRKDFQKIAGNIIENSVFELTDNRNYTNMSYEDKSEVINNVVNYAYNKARKDVLGMPMAKQYNKVNEWVQKGGRVSDYYANKDEINYSLQNESRYNTIKGFGIDYYDYEVYQKQVSKIKKQYAGTKNQKIRKQKVYEYINSIKGTKTQKIVLFKLLGNYSIKNYQNNLYNTINGFNISAKEKKEIWNTLF